MTFSVGIVGPFLQGMREFGYVDGNNIEYEFRYSEGYQDRLPALAGELVQLKPNVIVASAMISAVAAKNATSTIPIVSPGLADAVRLGLIASEARPSGNVTGLEPYVAGLPAKQMELAREIVPGATSVGLLTDVRDQKVIPQIGELEGAGRALEVKVVSADASRPDEIDTALKTLANQHVQVVIVLQTSMLLSENQRIAKLTLEKKLPAVYGYREHVAAGGLVSYGVDLRWTFHRAAYFVDRILRGTPPSDLPVEFPTKMWLAINVKTAKALGLTVPPTLLVRADEVIE
jgi:putative ABC transport system substrate-binding protein